ncbi:MAG: hypothetical protein ABIQ86_01390 [Steroidobacteraceae bacterium]
MKTTKALATSDSGPRLLSVTQYLEKNFPDFFAEARFQVGDDDYFLFSRFGQYLARSIEHNRTPRQKINRGFTVLNKMARLSAKHPHVRGLMVSGPLEHIMDAPKARELARKRLSPVAQGMLESLCE